MCAGILLIKNCDWCLSLLREMWEHKRYENTYYYEQSALLKCLKGRNEGLEHVFPFHSFVTGGSEQVKLFPHVAVLCHLDFNTNKGWKVDSAGR